MALNKQKWWKESVIYQVYPASFNDSNGDGWGDVPGINAKLDYLKHLGVDVVWVSPIYESPQVDMGYDISDYYSIEPRYGTLEDVDTLIAELKKRDMKLLMDLVVNHTSDQHEWFKQSRSSKEKNPKRDWYIWRPARYDDSGARQPPNNWSQLLGEANPAWTWDEATQEYYLTLFTPEQPDLNWENPDVRHAVHDILRFWLERGCSGFRMDVINLISKDQKFPDAAISVPGAKWQLGDKHYANGPRLEEYLQEIKHEVLEKYDAMTVGEMPFVRDEKEIIKVVKSDKGSLNMIFCFDIVDIDNVPGDFRMTLHPWGPKDLRQILSRLQRLMIEGDGWNSVFIENHDQPRSVTRYTDDSEQYRELGAKLLCLMQTTLCGTLFVYQGEELGMRNVPESWEPEEYKDIDTINYWKKMSVDGDKEKMAHAKKVMRLKARDNARTPVQWSSEANGGFCPADVKPWMRVNDDFKTVNAQVQREFKSDSDLSVLQFWKRGLANRKAHTNVFVYGAFEILEGNEDAVFAYRRYSDQEQWAVVLNFTGKEQEWTVPEKVKVKAWQAGNYGSGKPGKETQGVVKLRPWEGILGECEV